MTILDVLLALVAAAAIGLWFYGRHRNRLWRAATWAAAEERVSTAHRVLDDTERALGEARERLVALQGEQEPPAPLSEEQRQSILDPANRCAHCGGVHAINCPRVKRIRFRADGSTPLEVEFWADNEWPKDRIVFPEDVEGPVATVLTGS